MTELKYTKSPWKWSVMDYSAAILHGEDFEYDHILTVSPCNSCQKRQKESGDKEFKWGSCNTPNLYDAKLLEMAPTMFEFIKNLYEHTNNDIINKSVLKDMKEIIDNISNIST